MSFGTDGLSFNTLRGGNERRLNTSFPKCRDWTAAQWLQAIVGEVGEYANLMKKIERGDFTLDDQREELAKELADVITYVDLLAHHLDIDLGQAVMDKFNEVSERIGSRVYLDTDDWHLRPEGK